jgi:hypothetical protein
MGSVVSAEVVDKGNGTQGRSIALGPTPRAGEWCTVDLELGLTKAFQVVESAGRVASALDLGLELRVGVEDCRERGGESRGRVVGVQIYEGVCSNSCIANPCDGQSSFQTSFGGFFTLVPVIWAVGARTSYNCTICYTFVLPFHIATPRLHICQ